MKIDISWKNVSYSTIIEQRINKKMDHIKRFSKRISSAHFIISNDGKKNFIELQIKLEKAPLFTVKETDFDLIKALDYCINKATRKIKEYESKVKDKKYA